MDVKQNGPVHHHHLCVSQFLSVCLSVSLSVSLSKTGADWIKKKRKKEEVLHALPSEKDFAFQAYSPSFSPIPLQPESDMQREQWIGLRLVTCWLVDLELSRPVKNRDPNTYNVQKNAIY